MITHSIGRALGAVIALGAGVNGFAESSFQRVAERLDLDGSVLIYADFEGDGQAIGDRLSSLYRKAAEANPDVPPMPLDFAAVFESLGFGSIKAIGLSSKELEEGLARNRAVTLLNGEPAGLARIYGLEPTRFRAAEQAPAGATLALSGQLNLEALRDSLIGAVTVLMGPMGQGFADQALTQPIGGTELTGKQLIEALSGRFDLVIKQDYRNLQQPELSFWASVEGAGSLMTHLEQLIAAVAPQIEVVASEESRIVDLSPLLLEGGSPFGLVARQHTGSNRLDIYSDEGWRGALGTGDRLVDTEAFRRVASRLPEEAAFFSYSAGIDLGGLSELLKQDPEMAAYGPIVQEALEFLVGDFLKPNAAAYYRDGDALVSEQYAGFTYKQALVAAPMAGLVSLGAAALPAFRKFQGESETAQVENNLRMIAQTAQVVLLETGAEAVSYEDILASPAGVEVVSVMGETYDHIVIDADTEEISVELPNGEVVSVPVSGFASE